MRTARQRIERGGLIALVLALGACDSFLDVNTNPNVPQDAPPDITLPGVLATFSNGVIGSWPAKMSAEWMQQLSFNSSTRGLARYDLYEMRDTDAAELWDRSYTQVLNEAKDIMEQTEPKEEWAYHALAKIMYAWTLSVASDAWGPVPSSQALDPRQRRPAYDDQKTVYAEVQKLLDEAIAELPLPNYPSRTPALNDLLYMGDLSRWLKLANTLQGRMHLQLAYAPGEAPAARAQQALKYLAVGFGSNLDDADFRYPGAAVTPPGPQPWYIARSIPAYKVSEFYVELLRSRNDPRLALTADRAAADVPATVYRGHKNGTPPGPENRYSRVANFFAHDTASFAWLTFAQAKFMEAEAQLIAGNMAGADAAYRAGIRANMEKLKVAAASINTYINARPNLATSSNPLAEIIREKYVANFLRFEAWNDWRRTGYPALTTVPGALTDGIPQRFPTPASELSGNPQNVQATGIPAGLPGMAVKVWWASAGPR